MRFWFKVMNSKITKNMIRDRMKLLREELDFCLYRTWCNAIMEKCISLEEWNQSRKVHIYVSSINNEVDTLGLILDMLDEGKAVVVPKCDHKLHSLHSIRISSLEELLPSRYGIMEPEYNPEREVMSGELELIIVPLLAFDRTGARLGFGGGYYDSLLSQCNCPKIGLGYFFQEVDSVPVEPHDQKLDIIITEKEIIRIDYE